MKTRHSFIPFVLFSMWLCGGATLRAQDPIIQTKYTADPAPMVYNDTVFLYTGHDEDDAYSFKMFDHTKSLINLCRMKSAGGGAERQILYVLYCSG